MCGIAGLWNFTEEPASTETLGVMAEAMRHRGPDSSGVWTEGAVG